MRSLNRVSTGLAPVHFVHGEGRVRNDYFGLFATFPGPDLEEEKFLFVADPGHQRKVGAGVQLADPADGTGHPGGSPVYLRQIDHGITEQSGRHHAQVRRDGIAGSLFDKRQEKTVIGQFYCIDVPVPAGTYDWPGEVYECDWVSAPADIEIVDPGEVEFRATHEISIGSGFSVGPNAIFKGVIAP